MSLLDQEIMAELQLIMEDDFPKLINSFKQNSHKLIDELSGCLVDQDQDGFVMRIHSLKGSCRNIGAAQMGDVCQQIEHAARTGERVLQPSDLAQLKLELAQVEQALQHYL